MDSIKAQGLGLAVISYDSPEVLAAFSKLRGISFPLLSDPDSLTIKRFGLLNSVPEMAIDPGRKDDPLVKQETAQFVSLFGTRASMVGMAFPGTFLLDRRSQVTSRFFEDFYIERNTASSLMLKLGVGGDRVAGTEVTGAHLRLRTYPSDSAVAVGNRFSLVLDVSPEPRVHVYAPGAKGYRAVALKIDPQPFVRALELLFPKGEIYHFKPLNERVPVYQKPFQLLQEIVLEGTPAGQAAFKGKEFLTITGTLEYQACDDKLCFNPVALPLSWRLRLRELIRTPTLPAKP